MSKVDNPPAFADGNAVAEAIGPTLDSFVASSAPFIRRDTEEIYEQLLNDVQDYLRENAEWNIGGDIDRCRKIERDNIALREQNEVAFQTLEKLVDFAPDAGVDQFRDAINHARNQISSRNGDSQ